MNFCTSIFNDLSNLTCYNLSSPSPQMVQCTSPDMHLALLYHFVDAPFGPCLLRAWRTTIPPLHQMVVISLTMILTLFQIQKHLMSHLIPMLELSIIYMCFKGSPSKGKSQFITNGTPEHSFNVPRDVVTGHGSLTVPGPNDHTIDFLPHTQQNLNRVNHKFVTQNKITIRTRENRS